MLVMYSFLSRTSLMVKRDHFKAHLVHIVRAGGAHAVAHHFRLFHDLFHGNCPMMPRRWPSITRRISASRSLSVLVRNCSAAVMMRFGIGLHLDLRHGFDRDRDALLACRDPVAGATSKAHQFQRQTFHCFHHRVRMTVPRPLMTCVPPKAIDHQRLMRTRLAVQPGYCAHNEDHAERDQQTD